MFFWLVRREKSEYYKMKRSAIEFGILVFSLIILLYTFFRLHSRPQEAN